MKIDMNYSIMTSEWSDEYELIIIQFPPAQHCIATTKNWENNLRFQGVKPHSKETLGYRKPTPLNPEYHLW